jgi:hypothetical protein
LEDSLLYFECLYSFPLYKIPNSIYVAHSLPIFANAKSAKVENVVDTLLLAEALYTYFAHRGTNKDKTFHAAGQRTFSYLFEVFNYICDLAKT